MVIFFKILGVISLYRRFLLMKTVFFEVPLIQNYIETCKSLSGIIGFAYTTELAFLGHCGK